MLSRLVRSESPLISQEKAAFGSEVVVQLHRQSGLPWDSILALRSTALAAQLDDLLERDVSLEGRVLECSEVLAAWVARAPLPLREEERSSFRRSVLTLRRHLFNRRASRASDGVDALLQAFQQAEKVGIEVPESSRETVRQLRELVADLERVQRDQQSLAEVYELAISTQRETLKQAYAESSLLRAVAWGSPTALADLTAWREGAFPLGSKKERHACNLALAYVARAASKVSPRSSFTTVHVPGSKRIGSEVRASSLLYAGVVDGLLRQRAWLSTEAIRTNPTVKIDGSVMSWISWGTRQELRRQLPLTPPVEFLCRFFEAPRRSSDLLARDVSDSESETDALRSAALSLLECGLLEWVLPPGPEDPTFLTQLLSELSSSAPDDVRAQIGRFVSHLELLNSAEPSDIGRLQVELRAELDTGETLPNASHDRSIDSTAGRSVEVCYENVYEREELSGDSADKEDLRVFFEAFRNLPPLAPHQFRLSRQLAGFPRDKRCIPVTALSAHLSSIQSDQPESSVFPCFVDTDREVHGETFHLTRADISRSVHFDSPPHPDGCLANWAAYVQPGSDRWIVNQITPGFGTRHGRFLVDGDEETIRTRQRTFQLSEQALAHGARLAEVRTAYWNTANQTPPIFPTAIQLPLTRPAEWQEAMPVSALEVRLDEKSGWALLYDKRSGERIVPVLLGLERRSKSSLVRALQLFSPTIWEHPWYELLRRINYRCCPRELHLETSVARFPRIVFGERLVLQRRTWWIPVSTFEKATRSKGLARFRELREIQKRLELPDAVFVRSYNPRRAKREGKPQLFLFDAPLFGELLEKELRRTHGGVLLSECEPSPRRGHRAREVLLEWSRA